MRDWASPPTFRPLSHRLLDAAEGPTTLVGHQKLGVQFTPDICALPLQVNAACVSGVGSAKQTIGGLPGRAGDPFIVYAWVDCDLVGSNAEQLRRDTRAALENNEATVVERVFWTGGDFNTSPFLASDSEITDTVGGSTVILQTAASVVVTGAHRITSAVGMLEQEMAECYGGTPMLHVPRRALAHMAKAGLIKEKGQNIVTIGGNSTVVAGGGYPGTGPDGSNPPTGHVWMYATGQVKYWRSDIYWTARDAREFLRRDTNTTVLIAERRYVFAWDCCHFAVLVDLTGE